MNERKIELLDLVAIIYGGRSLIVGGTILVCLLAAGVAFMLPNQYESTVQILPPKETKPGFGFADLLSDLPIPALRLGEKGTPADIYIATLKSPTVRRRMVGHFGLIKVYEVETETDAVELLAERTVIDKSEEGTIVASVLDNSAQRASDMANHYLVVLDSTNKDLTQAGASERLIFVRQLLEREERNFGVVMERLQKFQSEHNAISIHSQASAVISAAAQMQMEVIQLHMTMNTMLNSGMSATHPDVKSMQERIKQHNQALTILRDGQEANAGSNGRNQLRLDENLFLPLKEIPEVALDLANIEKDVLVQKALMQMLLEQEAKALIEASNTTSTVQVLDYAVPAQLHSRPRRFLIVFIAGILSFFASVSYTIGVSYIRGLKQRWDSDFKPA